MNALRNDDENLSTADLVNPGRTRREETVTPRQVYAAGDPSRAEANRNDPPDYTPPPQNMPPREGTMSREADLGPRPVATQLPPARPVAPVPSAAQPVQSQSVARGPMPVQSTPSPNRAPAQSQTAGHSAALFPEDELHNFRARWDQVQTSFVDEPRRAVEQADSLVANVVKRIAEQFANERETLEKQWDRGDDVNTEDLRQALKRYRGFFDRLLSF